MTGAKGETRRCYNCGETGHLIKACPRPPKERDADGRGQFAICGRGRGGQKGGRGGNRANLMVEEEEEEAIVGLSEEDLILEIVRRRQKGETEEKSVVDDASTTSSSRGNVASVAYSATGTCNTLALSSISTTRSPDWIVGFGASRHESGAAREFSSYTHLAIPESIRTADGTAQPVVGKGTVKCTNTLTLSNVLHAPFPVNLLSISVIISQLNCVVLFDNPQVIFREKGTCNELGTGTLHKGLWYINKEGMGSALSSIIERSVEDLLLLHHRRLGHSSFPVLSRMYQSLFGKANKEKLVCNACELGKHTRSCYTSFGNMRSCSFDLIHSDVWGPCPTTTLNGFRYFVSFIDCFFV